MSEPVKYTQPMYLPKCNYCGSSIVLTEKYYFVAIEGRDQTDIRLVHRECFARNQTNLAREGYEQQLKKGGHKMVYDKGICDICGQPVWLSERAVYLNDGRVAHYYDCYEEAVNIKKKEGEKANE